nr:hypothetical protein [Mesorhizobium sp.]
MVKLLDAVVRSNRGFIRFPLRSKTAWNVDGDKARSLRGRDVALELIADHERRQSHARKFLNTLKQSFGLRRLDYPIEKLV